MCDNCNCETCPCKTARVKNLTARYLKANTSTFGKMRAIADRWAAKHPELRSRLERALALTGEVTRKGPTLFSVAGERDIYNVKITGNTSTCTCPDFVNRSIHCKHRLAVALVVTAEKDSQPLRYVST